MGTFRIAAVLRVITATVAGAATAPGPFALASGWCGLTEATARVED